MTTPRHAPRAPQRPRASRRRCSTRSSCSPSLPDALRKLDPRVMWRNPVMFVVEVGAVLTTRARRSRDPQRLRRGSIAVWLWLTVLFANLAEAVAEGRGKAQAATLRATRDRAPTARRSRAATAPTSRSSGDATLAASATGSWSSRPARSSPATATSSRASPRVDESAITGESAPVIRESGGDR